MAKITVALVRDLEKKVSTGEISFSRMVEILNENVKELLQSVIDELIDNSGLKILKKQELAREAREIIERRTK
jgi:hypothetical protein